MAVLSIPCAHPYVQSVQPRGGWDHTRLLPDPIVNADDPAQWWPHPAFHQQWWEEREQEKDSEPVDLVHLHFGFEHLTVQQTREFISLLRARRLPLVLTVHDIDNPHMVDQRGFHAQLRILLDDAARILTLTDSARSRLHEEFGVDPRRVVVVPHLRIVERSQDVVPTYRGTDIGIFLKSLRANVPQDPDFYLVLAQRCVDLGRRLTVFLHRDQEDSELFHALSGSPLVDIVVHDPFSDAELFSHVSECSAIVLPYVRGTHSGWLEMCRDLGIPVALPDCGCYADQLDTPAGGIVYRSGDARSAAEAACLLAQRGPIAYVGDREKQADRVRDIHELIYRELSTSKLNIAFIAPARFPIVQPFAGGLEAFCAMLVRAYRHHGHRVDLYAAAGSEGHLQQWEFPGVDWSGHERFRTDHTYPPGELEREDEAFHRVIAHVEQEVRQGNYDVVHNNSLHPAPFLTEGNVPMLTTLHTPSIERMQDAISRGAAERGASAVGKFAAVSNAAAKSWTLPEGVSVIANGFDEDVWLPGAGGPRAVWFGRVVPEKGLHYAIDAARILGLELDIAGRIGNQDYYESEIEPRLGDDTHWIGETSQPALAKLVGGSRLCLVTPDWEEPFGLVVIEALACGTPVAALSRGGVAEILAGFPQALADPHNPVPGLVNAARRVMECDRSFISDWAAAHFSGLQLVGKYTELLNSVVEEAVAHDLADARAEVAH